MPSRGASILPVQFANRAHPGLGLEPLCLSDLLKRLPPEHFTVPQSPGFHLLLLATAGHGDHFVDFARVRCRTGTLIHVRPGQVQQFVLDQSLEAGVLLFTPEFVLPTTSTLGLHVGSLIDDVAPEGYGQFEPRVFEGLS